MSPLVKKISREAAVLSGAAAAVAALLLLGSLHALTAAPQTHRRLSGVRLTTVHEKPPQTEREQEPLPTTQPTASPLPTVNMSVDTPPLDIEMPDLDFIAAEGVDGVPVPPTSMPPMAAPSVTIYKLGDLDDRPTEKFAPAPLYPPQAERKGIEGKVFVRITLDTAGRVTQAELAGDSESNRIFGEQALDAVRRWRFKPGTKSGRPVPCRVVIPIDFTIER